MLKSTGGNTSDTLNLIKTSLERARAKRNIFLPPVLTKKGTHPKAYNDTIGAMVSFFFELKFFKENYTREDIIEAFLFEHEVEIPKYKGNFYIFNGHNEYEDLIKRLKKLNIKPL